MFSGGGFSTGQQNQSISYGGQYFTPTNPSPLSFRSPVVIGPGGLGTIPVLVSGTGGGNWFGAQTQQTVTNPQTGFDNFGATQAALGFGEQFWTTHQPTAAPSLVMTDFGQTAAPTLNGNTGFIPANQPVNGQQTGFGAVVPTIGAAPTNVLSFGGAAPATPTSGFCFRGVATTTAVIAPTQFAFGVKTGTTKTAPPVAHSFAYGLFTSAPNTPTVGSVPSFDAMCWRSPTKGTEKTKDNSTGQLVIEEAEPFEDTTTKLTSTDVSLKPSLFSSGSTGGINLYQERIKWEEERRKRHEQCNILRASGGENMCCICMERPKNMAFSCGHVCCNVCSASLKRCHMCRTKITQKITLYL